MDTVTSTKVGGVASWNGGSIALTAGLAALISLSSGDLVPGAFGAAIAAAGAIEWRAGRKLRLGGDPVLARGRLVGAELTVLVLIIGYSMWRLFSVDVAAELAELPVELRDALIGALGGSERALVQMFTLALKLTYTTLIVLSLVYQGGLAWWYARKFRSAAA